MTRETKYQELVNQRKGCIACSGLVNPAACSGGIYDSSEIGPWSRWQGNLYAPLLIVGQDWSDEAGFIATRGVDEDSNPTDVNLVTLLKSIGLTIPPPSSCVNSLDRGHVFLTNVILCLKKGGMQAKVEQNWAGTCAEQFLSPLFELIRPKVIVTLGTAAFSALHHAYGIREPNWTRFSEVVEAERGFTLTDGSTLFPQYHCGSWGIYNRPLDKQLSDWEKVGRALASTRS